MLLCAVLACSRADQDSADEPDMSRLEEYIERLYEGRDKDDMLYKIQGTAQILSLCTQVANLEHLVQDQTLMGALTRVLNEEYKKSVELCYNIMRAFLAFSNFAEMHPILANFRVGNITMKVSLNIVYILQYRYCAM
jgi:Kinesin-associated protein (KAP)